jgi:hypothetical protein
VALFPSKDRQERELRRHRAVAADAAATTTMPTLIGAAMIAAAILLSTLIGAVGNRYEGFEGRGEDSAWLIDRLTGKVYRCQASDKGPAACDIETATGSIEQRKR